MRRSFHVEKMRDGYHCTLTETHVCEDMEEVKRMIRYLGLRHDKTALNEVVISPESLPLSTLFSKSK